MFKGSKHRTQAFSMLDHIEIKIAPLTEEENNERIKRLARKILRCVESGRRNRPANSEDIFSDRTFEQDIAI